MLDATEQAAVDKGWPVLWIISASMFGAVFIYAVLCYVLAGMSFIPVSNVPVEMIRYMFILLAAAILVLAYFLRKTMLSGRSAESSPPAGTVPSFFGKYTAAVIVSLAISEASRDFWAHSSFSRRGLANRLCLYGCKCPEHVPFSTGPGRTGTIRQ